MKKLIVIAVASALVAPSVFADTVNVNVYGRIRTGVEVVSGSGAAAGKNGDRQIRVVDNSSVLGFKGAEDLGDGWLINWQAEGQLESDGDSDGKLNSRNTFVALKNNDYGTLLAGKNDTPYKLASRYLRDTSFQDTTGEINALWGRGVGQNFYTRQSSTLQYLSPKWNGFDFKLGYAPDEAKTASVNKNRLSLAAGYENDNYFVNGAFETRPDTTGSNAAKATQLTGGVKLGKNGHVTAGVERFSLNGGSQTNLYLASKYKVTDTISLSGQFAKAGKAAGAADSGASLFGVAAQYDFSKRTNVAGYFTVVNNQSKAKYNFNDNAIDSPVTGADHKVIGLGVNHSF